MSLSVSCTLKTRTGVEEESDVDDQTLVTVFCLHGASRAGLLRKVAMMISHLQQHCIFICILTGMAGLDCTW